MLRFTKNMLINYLAKAFALQKLSAIAVIVLLAGSCPVASQQNEQSKQLKKREVAVTFDDLPAVHGASRYVIDNLLAKLKAEKVPAIGFVNELNLNREGNPKREITLLKQWLDAGHDLGNHSFSHVAIDQEPFERYAEDVIKGETETRKLLTLKGKKLTYYRHTQLRTGPTEEYKKKLAAFLSERGYTVAPVTIDNNDYIYAIAYLNAKRSGNRMQQSKIAADYIRYMEEVFAHFENLSREFLGYEVKQTLLLHANELNADHFDKLAQMLRRRGYTFITLDEALTDKAYQLPDAQSKRGLSWIHRWMLAKGLPMREEPLQPDWITKLARGR